MELSTQQNPSYFSVPVERPETFITQFGNPLGDKLHFSRRPISSTTSLTRRKIQGNSGGFKMVETGSAKLESIAAAQKNNSANKLNDKNQVTKPELVKEKSENQKSGFGNKISSLFRKSKSSKSSKHNPISESVTSYGFDASINNSSPGFVSPGANSLDSASYSSTQSSASSVRSNGENSQTSRQINENDFCGYSYDDCQTYATNMYYNMGQVSSFPISTNSLRPRNESFPSENHFSMQLRDYRDANITGGSRPTDYYNTNFSTFPNSRRHSIANSGFDGRIPLSASASSSSANNVVQETKDGYLVPVPVKPQRNTTNSRKNQPFLSKITNKPNESEVDLRLQNLHLQFLQHENLDQRRRISNAYSFEKDSGCTSTSTLCDQRKESSDTFSTSDSNLEIHESATSEASSSMKDEAVISFGKSMKENGNDHAKLPPFMNKISWAASNNDCEPYCSFCSTSTSSSSGTVAQNSKMDVAILSCRDCFFSQRAESQLKEFLQNLDKEGQKIVMELKSYDLRDIDHQEIAVEVHRAKVQIVIISHHLLDRLRHEATVRKKLSPINRVLRSKRVIAVLLSLSSEDIADSYQSVLARFHEWYAVELKSTSRLENEFCRKIADQVLAIYNVELSNSSTFSIFPTKVTKDQPKIVLLFKKQIAPEDNFHVQLSKGRNAQIIAGIRTTNPYTALIRIPDLLCSNRTCLIEVTPFINNQKLGTKLVKFDNQAKHAENNILDHTSKILPGFLTFLDEHISKGLSKNFSLHEDFSLDSSLEILNDALTSRGDIAFKVEKLEFVKYFSILNLEDLFPTVMHFATFYGLESTIWVLLEEGSGLEQCAVKNDLNETPLDIAQVKGFDSVYQMIKDYEEVVSAWSAVQIMKNLYEKHGEMKKLSTSQEINFTQNAERRDSQSEFRPDISENITNGENSVKYDNYEPTINLAIQGENNALSTTFYENIDDKADQIKRSELQDFSNSEQEPYDIPPPPLAVSVMSNYYDLPRPVKDDYCIPPSNPRPIMKTLNDSTSVGQVLRKKSATITNDSNGYIVTEQPEQTCEVGETNYSILIEKNNLSSDVNQHLGSHGLTDRVSQTSSHKTVNLGASDAYLIEILNDFKDNACTLQQLEQLFKDWKLRPDVQSDMKARRKELKNIREEYKIMQEELRKNKRANPLEKIINIFRPGKKKYSYPNLDQVKKETDTGNANGCSQKEGQIVPESTNRGQNVKSDLDNQPWNTQTQNKKIGPNIDTGILPSQRDHPNEIGGVPPRSVKTYAVYPKVGASFKKCSYVRTTAKSKLSHKKLNKITKVKTTAPPTPPRNENQASFNFINYKSVPKEIYGITAPMSNDKQ